MTGSKTEDRQQDMRLVPMRVKMVPVAMAAAYPGSQALAWGPHFMFQLTASGKPPGRGPQDHPPFTEDTQPLQWRSWDLNQAGQCC